MPDAGATASIEIFTDVPVDSDPTVLFDWSNGSPGHTFLQIRKTQGNLTVSQNIGFYPKTGWKVGLSAASTPGKFVDNQSHEFNASLLVSVTPAQLAAAILRMQQLSEVRYDVDDYNCTDWALEIFNKAVPSAQQLLIPRIMLPGNG